jgi:2-polyprenyl-3-methyl-5-hydroxy-6-metoxy-1,4-benzoquinol methylase
VDSGIAVLRCRECGHVFSSYHFDTHYKGFWGDEVPDAGLYWKHARVGMYREFQRTFVAGRSGRLLDMGAGLGFFLKEMASYPSWESYGSEISDAAVRYAREELGLTRVACTRLEESGWPDGSFDIVTMWDVIDHLPAPDPVLKRCHALLKDGGICFIRTPNISLQLLRARWRKFWGGTRPGTIYLQARDHAHHYSPASIRTLLTRNGFTPIRFIHLRPIATSPEGKRRIVPGVRALGFEAVRALDVLTGRRLNFDNLFVVATKGG